MLKGRVTFGKMRQPVVLLGLLLFVGGGLIAFRLLNIAWSSVPTCVVVADRPCGPWETRRALSLARIVDRGGTPPPATSSGRGRPLPGRDRELGG